MRNVLSHTANLQLLIASLAFTIATCDIGGGSDVDYDKLLQQRLQNADLSQQSSALTHQIQNQNESVTSSFLIRFDNNHDTYYYRKPNGQLVKRNDVNDNIMVQLLKHRRPPTVTAPKIFSIPSGSRTTTVDILSDLLMQILVENLGVSSNSSTGNELENGRQQALLFLTELLETSVNLAEQRKPKLGSVVIDVGTARLEQAVREISETVERTPIVQRPPAINLYEQNETVNDWNSTISVRFNHGINHYGLYSANTSHMLDELFESMLSEKNNYHLEEFNDTGTNFKLWAYGNHLKEWMIFKPKRQTPDDEVSVDTYYYNDRERHFAEIATHHLDKVLGLYLVPPVCGVELDFNKVDKSSLSKEFTSTMYRSPADNYCMYGLCKYFCANEYAFCGNGTKIEGSLAYFIPTSHEDETRSWFKMFNPWVRTYDRDDKLAEWEKPSTSAGFCERIQSSVQWRDDKVLLHLIDLHILDFMQGNMDRHHVNRYRKFGVDSFIIAFDNGRGFGRAYHDEMSILAPLYQCCKVRLSTVKTLLDLQTAPVGEKLSDRMRRSLSKDRLSPVLNEAHLAALDRRVGIVLDQIYQCLQQVGSERPVIIDA